MKRESPSLAAFGTQVKRASPAGAGKQVSVAALFDGMGGSRAESVAKPWRVVLGCIGIGLCKSNPTHSKYLGIRKTHKSHCL